jgi:hypothetical protein
MLKKTIKYTDFNGVERNEDFYFNLTEAELAEMNLMTKCGLKGYLEAIINTQDTPAIAELFKTIINKAYGVKSADGRKFMKSPEILEDFIYTQAYSNLYMSLIADANSAAEFINGIIPEDMAKQVKAQKAIEPKK